MVSADTGWTVQINNHAGTTIELTYEDLLAMPKTSVFAELYCYGVLVASGEWGGVKLELLLEKAGLDQEVRSVDFVAQDQYRVSVPIEEALRSDLIVAYEKDGAPLSEVLRLVIPGANGNVWIAKIISITASTSESRLESQPSNNSSGAPASTFPNQPLKREPVKPENVEPENETAIQPISPLVNMTQPEQETVLQESENFDDLGFSAEIEYGIIALIAAASVAAYLLHKQRNKQNLKLK
jgi:DMSO/TMAO reductase YedYZ molybdopterin-dependent catalytic subunit